jgi:hypothetical protein
MTDRLPVTGWLGWLGRQVGYVKKAVQTDVTPKQTTVYRKEKVEEVPLPNEKNVTLRRTTIDEVIVTPKNSRDASKPS